MINDLSLREQIPLLGDGDCYLDNAATSLMPRAVLQAGADYDARNRGNVGRGLHRFAAAADEAFSAARQTVADALKASAEEIVFVAGATAALNLVATALGETIGKNETVLLSVAEHHSNFVPWQIAARRNGFNIRTFAVDKNGAPDTAAAVAAIKTHRPRVVAVTHVSNVSGGVADVPAIAAAAKRAGAKVVVDGAQYVPHQLPDLPNSGADFYVFSAHKCYAPNGVGVLWGKCLDDLPTVIGGGGSVFQVDEHHHTPANLPQRLEPGTPPITPAIGLARAMQWMQNFPATATALELAMILREGLAAIPAVRLLFPNARPAPIVSFVVGGAHPHDICEWLAARRVAVRGGHHCARPLMRHLQIDGCVRASIAPYNNADDIHLALAAVREAAAKLA